MEELNSKLFNNNKKIKEYKLKINKKFLLFLIKISFYKIYIK